MASIEYSIRSRDESKAGVASAEQGLNRLRKGVELFGKIMSGAIIGESTMRVVRGIVRFGEASVQAAKDAGMLTPELDKITKSTQALQVAIGTGIATGFKNTFADISKGMEQIQGDKVATAVAAIIEKVGAVFGLLWELVWTTGTGTFLRVFVFLAKVGLEGAKSLFGIFKAVFAQIGLIWENVAYGVQTTWIKVVNWIVGALNKLLAVYNSSPLAKITGGLGQIGQLSLSAGAAPAAVDWAKVWAPGSQAQKNIMGLAEDFGQGFVDSLKKMKNDILKLFAPPTPVGLPPGPPGTGGGNGGGAWNWFYRTRPGATENPTESNYILPGSGVGSGPGGGEGLAAMAGPIGMVIAKLLEFAQKIEAVALLMAWGDTILNAMLEVIRPLVNSALTPLVGILVIFGRMLGQILVPLFKLLAPIIELVGRAFVFLYNYAIAPVANMFIMLFNLLNNLIGTIWNAIADAINAAFGWLGVHVGRMNIRGATEGFLEQISYDDLVNAGNAAIGSAAGGGNGVGASYSGAPTYNIYIDNTFETGSVIDASGTWDAFVTKVMRDGAILEAARQGA